MDRLGYARVKAMHYSAFVESQHPRDESGQFSEVSIAKKKRSENLKRIGYRYLASGESSKGIKYEIHGGSGDTAGEYIVLAPETLKEIGKAVVSKSGDGNYLSSVRVDNERQGIGSRLYDEIEKDIGRNLEPSQKSLTPKAEAFWSKRNFKPEFEPHPSAKLSPRKFLTVQADTAKLDSEWAKMKGHYLPKEGKGESEIEGRRAGFEEFLKSSKKIQQPYVVLNDQGQLAFNDGRHRTRVLMNRGLKTIPLTVPKGDADRIKQLVGAK